MRLSWVHRLGFALLLAVVACSLSARAIEADGPLGLVRVSGGSYHQARDAARVTEDILHRLDSLAGRARLAPVKPLVRLALPDSDWGTPSLIRSIPETGLPWRIEVRGDFQEALGDLAVHLARLDLSLWTGAAGKSVPRLDWLAVGMAENLFASHKARNRDLTMRLAAEGRLPSLERIVTWVRIPDGPMLEKAACGHAVGWMLAARGPSAVLDPILERVRAGDRVTADWLFPLLAPGGREDVEAAWRAAAASRDVRVGGSRPVSALLFHPFREALRTPVAELGLDRAPALDALSPAQLLAVRRAPGARQAARARALAAQRFAIGTPPEFLDVARRYHSFFMGVAGRTPAFWLSRRLRQADRLLRELEDMTLARAVWLDEMEGEGAAIEADHAGIFSRSALDRYMDEAEARLEAGEPETAEE